MTTSNDLVPFSRHELPIASMRAVYRVGDVSKRLDKLPQREHETLREALAKSKFKIEKTLSLKFLTSVNAYLYPKIFVCERR